MIYTKTGDKGETSLASGRRVRKDDVRIEAYGTVDELNSWVGLLRAGIQSTDRSADRVQTALEWVQNKLFNLGAALSEAQGEWIADADVKQLEAWIDAMQAELPRQTAFLLPAGGEAVCRCHVCRTVCRRAERLMLDCGSETERKWVNRLSDYFFVLSRYIGALNGEKESFWQKNGKN